MTSGAKAHTAGTEKFLTLRKKLFVLGCNVLVAILLLIYVSYGQYRITFYAGLQMPTVMTMEARLELTDPHETATATITDLPPLHPQINAATLAGYYLNTAATEEQKAQAKEYMYTVTVCNYTESAPTEGGEVTRTPTEVGLYYSIRIYSQGILPLKMVLVDESGTKYPSYWVPNSPYNLQGPGCYYFTQGGAEDLSKEAVFALGAQPQGEQDCQIFVGWDNNTYWDPINYEYYSRDRSYVEVETAEGTRNVDYRKEVDPLTVEAKLVSQPGTVERGTETPDIPIPQAEPAEQTEG